MQVLAASLMLSPELTKLELLEPPAEASIGERITVANDTAAPERPHVSGKTLERVFAVLKTNEEHVATYNGAPLMTSKGPVRVRSLKNAMIR